VDARILIPLICPVETPLWMLAVATAFSVIFVKEVFGGTGYNVFNVALVTRAFLFFAYPAQMSGDKVFVSSGSILGLGYDLPDGFTGATPLGQIASFAGDKLELLNLRGDVISTWDAFIGLIPGSFLDPVHPHRRGDTSRHRHSIMANHAECGCRRTAHGMDSQCVRDLDISGVVPVTT